MTGRDALLAGLPRAGTTLTCELLNLLPDTVALDEPIRGRILSGRPSPGEPAEGVEDEPREEDAAAPDHSLICEEIERFVAGARESLATRKTAVSKQVEGRVLGRKIADDDGSGARERLASRGEIRITKPLSPEFLLVVKHAGAFTALLEPLTRHFDVYAVIRNPLAILGSWQTVPFNVSEGRHLVAERLDRDLARALARTEDRLDRQLVLLSWFFARFRAVLPEARIIRYEEIVASHGKALTAITDRASALDEPLENRNRALIYDHDAMRQAGERLLGGDGAYWSFYTKRDVERLLEPEPSPS